MKCPPLKSFWPLFLFVLVLAIGFVFFWEALPSLTLLRAPDATPGFERLSLFRRIFPWLSGIQPAFNHDDLLKLFPTLVYHELSFIVATALVALSTATYLHILGLPILACCGGGLLMAFSGYHFTLFNAGHRGYFIMMPYAIWLFALVERILVRPRWFHFSLVAFCLVSGICTQPDIFLFFLLLLAAYTLFRFCQNARALGLKSYTQKLTRRWLWGCLIFLLAFASIGWYATQHLFQNTLQGRLKQRDRLTQTVDASQSTDAADPSASPVPAQPAVSVDANWDFATSWSLPPSDLIECIAPGIKGLDTGNPHAPYWGKLGETKDFPNYRQHTLYLGIFSIGLACFALLSLRATSRERGLALFWVSALGVAFLLALGRFTPFYRLFYALPMMDTIRCPVKMIHLVELSLTVLASFGLAQLLRPVEEANVPRFRQAGKITLAICLTSAVLCVIHSGLSSIQSLSPQIQSILSHFFSNGNVPSNLIQSLATRYQDALWHSAWRFALVATALVVLTHRPNRLSQRLNRILVCVLIFAATLDFLAVARPYRGVENVAYKYRPNPLAELVSKKTVLDGTSFSYLHLTQKPIPASVGFLDSLEAVGMFGMDPRSSEGPDSIRIQTLLTFKEDLLKRWQFWGARAVMASPEEARYFAQKNLGRVFALYNLSPDLHQLIPPQNPLNAQIAVLEPYHIPPAVAVYYHWACVKDDAEAFETLQRPTFNLLSQITLTTPTPLPPAFPSSASSSTPHTPGEWVVTPQHSKGNCAVVKVTATQPGLAMIRENSLRKIPLTATVNGKPTPVYRANALFACVPVEKGTSTIVIRPALSIPSLLGTLTVATFILMSFIAFIRNERAPSLA